MGRSALNEPHILVALANPHLRRKLVSVLQAHGLGIHIPHDLDDLKRLLVGEGGCVSPKGSVLVLDEAFIFPHVYEECERFKAAAQKPLTIVLLVERRTRTRSDWNGADRILRLPVTGEEVGSHVLAALAKHQ